MQSHEIKVLIVDDSPVARELMEYIITSDPQMKVVGMAEDGEKALEFLENQQPDVILLDIVMPKMDGFELTSRIMKTNPLPIIVISGVYNREEILRSFHAMDAGALAILEKPKGVGDAQYKETARFVIETIRAMAKVKMTVEVPSSQKLAQTKSFLEKNVPIEQAYAPIIEKQLLKQTGKGFAAVGIGASIGGPQALCEILKGLPQDYPIPIFIVQHIAPGFIRGLVDWLSEACPLKVTIPQDGETAVPGKIYLAPDKYMMEIHKGNIISLKKNLSVGLDSSSIGCLFRSMTETFGDQSIGVLLSGTGHDGAKELLMMKEKGGLTIVQDEESSLVFDLPKLAIQMGAAKKITNLKTIVSLLKEAVQNSN
jgi:two-component system chemotaxis response regulator CheB